MKANEIKRGMKINLKHPEEHRYLMIVLNCREGLVDAVSFRNRALRMNGIHPSMIEPA